MPRQAAPQRRRRDFFTEAVIGLTTVALLSLGGVTASAVTEPTPAPQVDAADGSDTAAPTPPDLSREDAEASRESTGATGPTPPPSTPAPDSEQRKNEWVLEDGRWYYFDGDGVKATGWLALPEGRYYLDELGQMQTGWVQDNGAWYFFADSGLMRTGWVRVSGVWYHLAPNGEMNTGWLLTGGNWYYLSASGAMAAGWLKDGANWYYLNPSGSMATGWLATGGNWYYLTASGAMATGWLKDGAYWYFLAESGVMVTGVRVIDGRSSTFATNGAWLGYTDELQASASSLTVLVNKRNPLNPLTYVPPLVSLSSVGVGGGQSMRPEAAWAMVGLVSLARGSGIELQVASGYRSYRTQQSLFANYVSRYGRASAETFSARAGYSEHQTGLAADVWAPAEGCRAQQCFANTRAGRFVADNAWRYGFIVRYPSGYQSITGYIYEPWHLRYVGTAISQAMRNGGVPTYEHYLGASAAPTY